MHAKFVAVPTLEFNFAGVQSQSPLTALKRQDSNITLTSGLNFGPGLNPSNTGNVGNEFHVADFSTGSNLQSAIDNNDYLTFAVQPVAGMVMYADSVSFSLCAPRQRFGDRLRCYVQRRRFHGRPANCIRTSRHDRSRQHARPRRSDDRLATDRQFRRVPSVWRERSQRPSTARTLLPPRCVLGLLPCLVPPSTPPVPLPYKATSITSR